MSKKVSKVRLEPVEPLSTVEVHADSYLALQEQIKRLQTEAENHKRVIKHYLETATPCGAVRMCQREWRLIEGNREVFNLPRARQVLGEQLSPFIKVVAYKILKVK